MEKTNDVSSKLETIGLRFERQEGEGNYIHIGLKNVMESTLSNEAKVLYAVLNGKVYTRENQKRGMQGRMKVTIAYCAKVIGIHRTRVKRYRDELMDCGLIERVEGDEYFILPYKGIFEVGKCSETRHSEGEAEDVAKRDIDVAKRDIDVAKRDIDVAKRDIGMSQNATLECSETRHSDVAKRDTINNSIDNNIINNPSIHNNADGGMDGLPAENDDVSKTLPKTEKSSAGVIAFVMDSEKGRNARLQIVIDSAREQNIDAPCECWSDFLDVNDVKGWHMDGEPIRDWSRLMPGWAKRWKESDEVRKAQERNRMRLKKGCGYNSAGYGQAQFSGDYSGDTDHSAEVF